ncbi:hypothetical protein Ciccas_004108 [Cichlidogyrus casuarinus]|uniref:ARF7 effector protein C-terminal domain-containing protein n=1 Tax=Cichlidogyrus casuarinus TaxID=1844966 RepID=A0ABD2QCF4_9PLAT
MITTTSDNPNSRITRLKLRLISDAESEDSPLYDSTGLLLKDSSDLCDCTERSCPGCFWPCVRCNSPKCGPVCRIRRCYIYKVFTTCFQLNHHII